MNKITSCAIALFLASACVAEEESPEAVRSVRPNHNALACGPSGDCLRLGPAGPKLDCTVACGDGAWQPQCGEECDPTVHDSCSDVCTPLEGHFNPVYKVGCGQTVVMSTGDLGSTEGIGSYSCATWTPQGRELAFEFEAPDHPMEVDVRVTGYEQFDPFVFLVDWNGDSCTADGCMRAGRQTSFPSELRERMAIVVDSRDETWGTFELTVTCTTPPTL